MKQIVITMTMLLATVAAFTQCFDHGSIELKEQGDTLEIYHVDPAFACVPPDSTSITWWVACNPFNQEERTAYVTGPGDTLKIEATGWLAVWATTSFFYDSLPSISGIAVSSNTVVFEASDAPQATINITPNPSDGHFAVQMETNAPKQYLRIIGPLGMVYGGWFYGTGEKAFDLLAMNPNGIYHAIVDWHFGNTCGGVVRTRATFVVQR